MGEVSLWSDENVLKLGNMEELRNSVQCTKTHQTVHFKVVNFMACELYLKMAYVVEKKKTFTLKYVGYK